MARFRDVKANSLVAVRRRKGVSGGADERLDANHHILFQHAIVALVLPVGFWPPKAT